MQQLKQMSDSIKYLSKRIRKLEILSRGTSVLEEGTAPALPLATFQVGVLCYEVGELNLRVVPGKLWSELSGLGYYIFDSAQQDDSFTLWYADGAGDWSTILSQQEIDNTHYDDGTGTLATLTSGYYGVRWVILGYDGSVAVLMGTDEYATLEDAQATSIPLDVPPDLETASAFVGRIIIQKDALLFSELLNIYAQTLGYIYPLPELLEHDPVTIGDTATINLTLVGQYLTADLIASGIDHGGLAGLGDDDHTQYFNATRHTLSVHTSLGLVPDTRQITAGNGLTGGGTLAGDRTIDLAATDSSSIDFTVNADSLTAVVLPAGVDHNQLLNYSANRHIDHTAVTLTAGDGLTGGGDISANRTFAVGAGTLITVGADAVNLSNGTAQYQAIVTNASNIPTYTLLSSFAGDGLTFTSAFAVGVSGLGLSTTADAVVLTSSSNPGANARILASDASGYLQLTRLGIATAPSYPLHVIGAARIDGDLTFVGAQKIDTTADNLTLNPAADLILTPAGNEVKVTTGVTLQSDNYVSRTTGWGISYAGWADFRYMYLEELQVKTFIADLEQSLAGSQIIAKSVAPLAQDFTVPAAGGTASLYVSEFIGYSTFRVFVDGDMVRLRQFSRTSDSLTVADCWGTVVYVSTTSGVQRYTFTRSSSPNEGSAVASSTIETGALVLDYGVSGNGIVETTAIDGSIGAYAPYQQIVSWTTHPVSGSVTRTRLGNLRGIFSVANEYGLYAGAGITDASQYLRISNEAIEAHNLPIKMYDGASVTMQFSPTAPSFAMGSTLPSAYGTGDGLWMGKDTVYKFRVGDVDGELLAWDGTDLYVKSDASNYLKFTGTSMEFYSNATKLMELTNTPAIRLGLSSAENILITSTSVDFLNNSTSIALLDGASFRIGAVADNNVLVSAGHVQIRNGTNVYTDLAAGVLTLGLTSSGQYITINSGAISMRNATIERIGLTSAGILTIKNSGGNAVFTFDASAGAEFTLPLTLATTGGIYQGTGTFASPTTGLKIWNDGGIGRIAGYASGVLQWGATTGGVLSAGAGSVILDATGIKLDHTDAANIGTIYKEEQDTGNYYSFIHDFSHPTGGTAKPAGYNLFIGVNAGNFTMGSTATETYHASNNIGIGQLALRDLTLGYSNTALGRGALYNVTTGGENIGIGSYAAYYLETGFHNIAVGRHALESTVTGSGNISLGFDSCQGSDVNNTIAIGYRALYDAAGYLGNDNIAIGIGAGEALGYMSPTPSLGNSQNIVIGYFAADSFGKGARSIIIGAYADGSNSVETNESIAIGYLAVVGGTTNIAIGSSVQAGGTSNIAIGKQAISSGTNGIAIGTSASTLAYTNAIAIGNNAVVAANNNTILGNSTMSLIKLYASTTEVTTDLRVGRGLYVGATGVAPSDNNIIADGVIQVSAGSSTLPSYTFISDTDTGIYSPSGNEVGISCGTSLIGTFKSTGLDLEKTLRVANQGSNPTYSASYNTIYAKGNSLYSKNQDDIPYVLSGISPMSAFLTPLSFYGARAIWTGGIDAGTNKYIDHHPNANHLTWTSMGGGMYPTYPLVTFCPEFDGSTSYCSRAIGGNVSVNTHFTFGAWVYLDSVTRNHGIVRMGTTTVSWTIIYYYNAGGGYGYFELGYYQSDGTYRNIATINHNTIGWVFVGAFMQHDGSGNNVMYLYVNLASSGRTNEAWTAPRAGVGNFEIGRGATGSYWLDGKLATCWLAGNILTNVPQYYSMTRGFFTY